MDDTVSSIIVLSSKAAEKRVCYFWQEYVEGKKGLYILLKILIQGERFVILS